MKVKLINYKKAFTLIELLVVVAIISLLTSVILSSLASSRMKANDTKISQDLRQFRIAVDLYYNDNHTYPPTAMVNQENDLATKYEPSNNWTNKLSFFIKTAEAATINHETPLCHKFDSVADNLVALKYLSSHPVHPYDNDAKGVCYKAISNSSTFSVYASLTTQVSAGSGVINKRTGFILGDISSSGISNLADSTTLITSTETPYPIGSNGNIAADLATSIDAISGITNGATGSYGNSVSFNSSSSSASGSGSSSGSGSNPTYTLTVNAGTIRSGYSLILTYNTIGGASFTSPTSFTSRESVSVYAAIYNGISYLQPNFVGCDSVLALTNCNVSMFGNRTVTVSAP